jgi:hypothetical protein
MNAIFAASGSSIPGAVPPIPLSRSIPGLCWSGSQARALSGALQPRSVQEVGYEPVLPGTPLELEPDTFVVVGEKVGEGRQGIVYAIATCPGACIKLRKTDKAAKQFRREMLGYPRYVELNVPCPAILGANETGLWILKTLWREGVPNGPGVLNMFQRALPAGVVRLLRDYALRFETVGLCVDGLPTNVLFTPHGCGSYETTLWPSPPTGSWTFAGCFLPMWLPDDIPQESADGWPPFRLSADMVNRVRSAWATGPAYAPWRDAFGDFPDLCPEWWDVR